MKKLYEGATAATVIFFLIIAVGSFIMGTKGHRDKSRHDKHKERSLENVKKSEDKKRQEITNAWEKEKIELEKKYEEDLQKEKKRLEMWFE